MVLWKIRLVIYRGCNISDKIIGNNDFSLSDHKYLGITIKIEDIKSN